ncbi:transferase [Prochlorococcus marinus str. MU1404]|uniref:acyltransferase n=1 Tax=Prochlorococcus marinus TaxID=1219 RepID=UPI001ADA15DE|nr:acyltransferase [Prochlorococcus marinus]MBO8230530.1 acyltransferase [Prochlorococcus marinus XMU1404]MBW3073576.1 transferase [Prochlorococcus marinus str. MU1404]
MRLISLIIGELKDWLEFLVRNIPGRTGFLIRSLYYKIRLKKSFKENRFESGLRIEFPQNILIGSYSYFGLNCKIYASEFSQIKIGSNVTFNSNVMINARGEGKIFIGNNVLIGPNVVLRSNNHCFEDIKIPIKEQGMEYGDIFIEDDVWISSNSVILPNCKIGKGSIIGAGAVVTKNVESYSIVVGVPAKQIRKRDLKIKE